MDLDKEIKLAQSELDMYIKQAQVAQRYLNELIELKKKVMGAIEEDGHEDTITTI